ncbi:DUF1972 domain-containing protein [Maritalea porphyrae]|nr:DUF1972 domain-containing protein [Maritalea porphyrae]
MSKKQKTLNILGTRGVPARHGGFETFAEHLALFLTQKGWLVRVYCQSSSREQTSNIQIHVDRWHGVERVHIGTQFAGVLGTMEFDLKCVKDVVWRDGIDLVLGYNTAIFNIIQRMLGRTVIMNMDGIEWHRDKWSLPAKFWLLCNELIGANVSSIAIADNPHIATHIAARSFKSPTMIPYGADQIETPSISVLDSFQLKRDCYFLSIARIEPENSILEIVTAFSNAKTNQKLVIVGPLDDNIRYHKKVRAAANQDVIFPGAIYDKTIVGALRYYARAHIHGHRVGGTNPSLVEAMAAGSAVIAHDNLYNRWTAGDSQFFFSGDVQCQQLIEMLSAPSDKLETARYAAAERHRRQFTWGNVLSQYEALLEDQVRKTYPR